MNATALNDRLDAFVATGRAGNLHGVVVRHRGRTVLERYFEGQDHSWARPLGTVAFGPDTLHDLRSVSKSVVALLYGIALDRGQVPPPDAPLLAQFPEYADVAADPRRAARTVRHALTMTLGLEWNEDVPYTSAANSEIAMELAPDRNRFVLQRPVVEEPGRHWSYCGGATALLGALIVRGTGQALPDFAGQALFAPLGIDNFDWLTGTDGVAAAASGLRLAPRDLATIGEAVREDGRAGGRQVIPQAWLREALRPHVSMQDGTGYGYQWYVAGDAHPYPWVAAMGNGGQRLYVLPAGELVVAICAGDYDRPEAGVMPAELLDQVVLA